MLFNSYEFIFLFLPIFLLLYYAFPRRRTLILTLGSYFFYMCWKPAGAALLLGCTFINYHFGKALFKNALTPKGRFLCGLSVSVNLFILGYFKYLGFFQKTINAVAGHEVMRPADIALPIGISFFIFQCISYTVDLYRGKVKPTQTFLDFACYVSLFPHLVAGPILRYSFMEKQLRQRDHSVSKFAEGVAFFSIGLAKKVLIADTLGAAADQLFNSGGGANAYSCWMGLLAYSLQIFYDFAGYSDMAVGLGRFMGFEIPQNFNSPYLSTSISEFWRRWHMTLSYWLRDFLYIPLGGSKKGPSRTYVNLIITMFLGGLWHGASWTFVIWGMWHGGFLALERMSGDRNPLRRAPVAVQILFTNFIVMIGWAFFRADTLGGAINVITGLFGANDATLSTPAFLLSPALLSIMAVASVLVIAGENIYHRRWNFNFTTCAFIISLFAICAILVLGQEYSPFLYFQF